MLRRSKHCCCGVFCGKFRRKGMFLLNQGFCGDSMLSGKVLPHAPRSCCHHGSPELVALAFPVHLGILINQANVKPTIMKYPSLTRKSSCLNGQLGWFTVVKLLLRPNHREKKQHITPFIRKITPGRVGFTWWQKSKLLSGWKNRGRPLFIGQQASWGSWKVPART